MTTTMTPILISSSDHLTRKTLLQLVEESRRSSAYKQAYLKTDDPKILMRVILDCDVVIYDALKTPSDEIQFALKSNLQLT